MAQVHRVGDRAGIFVALSFAGQRGGRGVDAVGDHHWGAVVDHVQVFKIATAALGRKAVHGQAHVVFCKDVRMGVAIQCHRARWQFGAPAHGDGAGGSARCDGDGHFLAVAQCELEVLRTIRGIVQRHRVGDRAGIFVALTCASQRGHSLVTIVHHIRAGWAAGVNTGVAAARCAAYLERQGIRALYVRFIRTGGNLHAPGGGPHRNDDDLAGSERDDQVRAHGRVVDRGSHHDQVAFNHLRRCAQGDLPGVSGWFRWSRCIRSGCLHRSRPAGTVLHLFRSAAGVGQRQRGCDFHHTGQAREAAASTTTTRQHCGGGFQICQRILPLVDGRNQAIDLRISGSGHGRFGRGNILEHILVQGHVLVLTHGHGRLTIGLQLDRTAGGGHELCIHRDTHACAQRGKVAIRIADPCLTSQLRNENGGGCHDLSL